tara:strand:+ start:1276 stop:2055 length:780 start_codon:yes stop_codon:yes gene_type:complete
LVFQKKASARDVGILPDIGEAIPLIDKHQKELITFCEKAEKENDNQVQQLMKNYIVIRLKSVMEYHLKAFIADLIDGENIKAENITLDDSISVRLDVFDNLQKEQFTRGKILTSFLGTLPPSTIDDTFSRINEVNFFPWYQEIEELRTNIQSDDPVEDFIFSNNKHRNDIIHNLKDNEDTIKELRLAIPALLKFCKNVYAFTCLNLAIKKDDQKIIQGFCTMLKVKKNDFEEITSKHSQSLHEHRVKVTKKKKKHTKKN